MLEPANHFVYGLGIQAWEFRDGARSLRGTRIFRQIRGRKRPLEDGFYDQLCPHQFYLALPGQNPNEIGAGHELNPGLFERGGQLERGSNTLLACHLLHPSTSAGTIGESKGVFERRGTLPDRISAAPIASAQRA
jgi:hypothetical protein